MKVKRFLEEQNDIDFLIPLRVAIEGKRTLIVKMLLAGREFPGHFLDEMLKVACMKGYFPIATQLFYSRARDPNGKALEAAIDNNHHQLVAWLLSVFLPHYQEQESFRYLISSYLNKVD